MISRSFLLAVAAAVLSGCASDWGIPLAYTPDPQEFPGLAAKTFSVLVTDERSYVVNHDKQPSYLGKYKGLVGDTWDAATDDNVPLADHMRNDLRRELQALRLIEDTTAPLKQIKVRILDWNFSAGKSARYWYNVEILVADSKGRQLALSVLKDDKVVKGTLVEGAKWSLEQDVPTLYSELMRKLVRENPSILEALRVER